ncbi:MAG: S-methyl-5-thioribose-1-phosphate isomerase [Methanospirillaceae archaeon]|nr:S-methyl-5-thioribose-1-phosphate isomerase [Methanospirillaceae archaeon]
MKEDRSGYTIWFDRGTPGIGYIDQTCIPGTYRVTMAYTPHELAGAIQVLAIRGAPALGVAGAYGVALAALCADAESIDSFLDTIKKDADMLRRTRPTAVNLSYGIDRVFGRIRQEKDVHLAKEAALAEADAVAREDEQMCRGIGETGNALIPNRCTILTHCNAGALACSTWGTALGVIRSAVAAGKEVSVYACETRPLLQGARLTAWELKEEKIPVTVITDSMAAMLMRKSMIDLVIVGADRITRDVVVNKIGTYMHAVCAKYHGIPFYVAAPLSTFDLTSSEIDITIEERDRDEIARWGGHITVPPDVSVYNPAFDPTPVQMITGIITEFGLLRLPDDWDRVTEQVSMADRIIRD